MDSLFKQACSAYLARYIKKEVLPSGSILHGWYHYIESTDLIKVGVVATAEMLILIKEAGLCVDFDCSPMVKSLFLTQNSDGGWSYKTNVHVSSTHPTALSVYAILLWAIPLDDFQKKAITRAIEWLLRHKNDDSLWGPIGKKEKTAYTYFSCAILYCLHKVTEVLSLPDDNPIRKTIVHGCKSLLTSFRDDNIQCGWGTTIGSMPTVFHTAYTIKTLLSISAHYANTHQILKGCAYLKQYYYAQRSGADLSRYQIGISEIYPHRSSRLSYIHSVDVYVPFALLLQEPTLMESMKKDYLYFSSLAERTDWRYNGFSTAWRLFDIVVFCNFFDKLLEGGSNKPMNHYKIALTFAGETRDLVKKVAELLANKFCKEDILYDKFHEAEFARPQLDVYLQALYHDHSDLIVVFICSDYPNKRWCGVEWRAIRDILNHMEYSKIMYIKATSEDIQTVSLPGFYPSEDGYVDACNHSPQEIANLIIQRFEQQNK